VVDREALHVGIRRAIVETVHGSRVVARADTQAAGAEAQLRGVEQLMKQLLACVFGELVKRPAGRVGESGAEADHFLVLAGGDEADGIRGALPHHFPGNRRLGCEALSASGYPHFQGARRRSGLGPKLERAGGARRSKPHPVAARSCRVM